jgi:hypothetical protein
MSGLKELVDQKDLRVFVYATGAGAGIQQKIWHTVGCSSFFVGAAFPYASNLSSKALGYKPDQFVSVDMAIDLSMSAYVQAFEFGKKAIGIGLTASVASGRIHRGDHRIFVSAFNDEGCFASTLVLPKAVGEHARMLDGLIADDLAIATILHAAGQNYVLPKSVRYDSDIIDVGHFDCNAPALQNLYNKPYFTKFGKRLPASAINMDNVVFYPGNFDPLHEGHVLGSEAVLNTIASRFGKRKEVIFTTTMNPPHKTALTTAQALQRVAAMQGYNFLLTTGDALYIDKARNNPGASFVIGADALIRMLDPKWGIQTQDLLDEFAKLNTTFFVLGRLVDGRFLSLQDIEDQFPILHKYSNNFEPVPGRWDISSTEIRNKIANP